MASRKRLYPPLLLSLESTYLLFLPWPLPRLLPQGANILSEAADAPPPSGYGCMPYRSTPPSPPSPTCWRLPRLRRQANFTCQLYVEPDQDTSKQKQNPKNGPFFLSLSSIAPCDGPSGGPVSPAAVCTDVGFVALIYLTRMLSCCVQTGQTSNVSHLGSIHDCFRTKKKKWLEGRQAI